MKQASIDEINGWLDGKKYPGVQFSHNDTAYICSGPRTGELAAIMSLEAFEPEPHYHAELGNGQFITLKQSEIRKFPNEN